MQTIIDNITTLIFLLLVLIMMVVIVAILFLARSGKNKNADASTPLHEMTRKDAAQLVPIEDIRDNMIIEKGANRFSAVITCMGTDFYTKSRDEKIAIQNSYIDFIFALEEPITFRQYDEGINLDYTIGKLKKVYSGIEEELFNRTEDYKELSKQLRDSQKQGEQESEDLVAAMISEKKKLESLQWRLDHINSEIRYLERLSGGNTGRQRQKLTYVVSWEPDLNQRLITQTPLTEIAARELDRLCQVKIRQLTDAGAIARRATTKELIDMCRRHSAPHSSNLYTIDQVLNSTYFDDITTTEATDRRNTGFDREIAESLLYGGSR